jgi:hypothetical protein
MDDYPRPSFKKDSHVQNSVPSQSYGGRGDRHTLVRRIRRAAALLAISLGALGISSQTVIAQQPQVTGQWVTLPYPMPINPIHVHMLHTGKVLIVAVSENNPATRNLGQSRRPYGIGPTIHAKRNEICL